MRNEIAELLALEEKQREEEAKKNNPISLTKGEASTLEKIGKTRYWKSLSEEERDLHSIKFLLHETTALTPNQSDSLAKKANALLENGLLTTNLSVTRKLYEMASSLSSEHDGEDHGVALQGNGSSTPKGDADKGVDQKPEHGDKSVHSKDGYLDEDDDDDENGPLLPPDIDEDDEENGPPPDIDGDGPEQGGDFGDDDDDGKPNFVDPEETETDAIAHNDHNDPTKSVSEDHYPGDGDEGGAEEVPIDTTERGSRCEWAIDKVFERLFKEDVAKDAPDAPPADQRAAGGSELEKGKKQNESRRGSVKEQEHKPTASDPGEPSTGKHNDKPDAEKRGDVPDHPDYSTKVVKKEDPSNSPLNKGPASITAESFQKIESLILTTLAENGINPGTRQWEKLYQRGFSRAIQERSRLVNERLRGISEQMPGFIKKKIEAREKRKMKEQDFEGRPAGSLGTPGQPHDDVPVKEKRRKK